MPIVSANVASIKINIDDDAGVDYLYEDFNNYFRRRR